MKWAVVGLVAGAVFLVATLSTSYWLSFIGFVCMLGSALLFERNLRKLGRAGLDQLSKSVRANGLREALGGAGRRVRERFRRDEERTTSRPPARRGRRRQRPAATTAWCCVTSRVRRSRRRSAADVEPAEHPRPQSGLPPVDLGVDRGPGALRLRHVVGVGPPRRRRSVPIVRAMPWTASPDCGTAATNRVAVSAMVSDAGNRTPAASPAPIAWRHDSRTLSAGVLARRWRTNRRAAMARGTSTR